MDIKTDLKVTGSHTVSSLTTAGFVKSSASGLLSSEPISKARAYCDTNISITSAGTVISLNHASYDTDGIVNTSTNRITPKRVGYYIVTGQMTIKVTATTGDAFVSFYLNGGWYAMGTVIVNRYSSALTMAATISHLVPIVTANSDYIQLVGYSNYDTTLDTGWQDKSNYITVTGPF